MFQGQRVCIRRHRVEMQPLLATENLREAVRGPEGEASAVVGPGWGVRVKSSHRTEKQGAEDDPAPLGQ